MANLVVWHLGCVVNLTMAFNTLSYIYIYQKSQSAPLILIATAT